MNELTETEKAYLAGFLDGDGCITILKGVATGSPVPSHRVNVIFSQANLEYLQQWRDRTNAGSIHEQKANYGALKQHNKRKMYHWRLCSAQAETMLRWLLPYLDIKKEQAEIALEFRKTKTVQHGRRRTPATTLALRDKYQQTLKNLKRGGEMVDLEPAVQELRDTYDCQLSLFSEA